jgi:hypothetical protein
MYIYTYIYIYSYTYTANPNFESYIQHQLLEKAQSNLGVILDSPQDSKDLANMLLKIADNCTSNLTVQQYVFTRIEEILGTLNEIKS